MVIKPVVFVRGLCQGPRRDAQPGVQAAAGRVPALAVRVPGQQGQPLLPQTL